MRFDGKVVAVTGGAGGIGLATGQRLGAEGAAIVVLDLGEGLVDAAVGELRAAGIRAIGRAVDTTDEAALTAAMAAGVAEFGRLDGLVTAAGVRQTQADGVDLDLAVWERVLNVNVTGTFLAARVAARLMAAQRPRGGSIVTVSSVTGIGARSGYTAYCTSKAAVIHLTKVLALELAASDIRVNSVCPAPTATAMIEEAVAREGPGVIDRKVRGSLEEFRPGIPLGRLSEPGEQAAAIAFLLSEDASFVTGAALPTDGGTGAI